jgi:hypothetical protein
VPSETVSAQLLTPGDVIRVEGEDGWFVVGGAFQEGVGGPMDLDLIREDDEFSYNWHIGPEYQIERRI